MERQRRSISSQKQNESDNRREIITKGATQFEIPDGTSTHCHTRPGVYYKKVHGGCTFTKMVVVRLYLKAHGQQNIPGAALNICSIVRRVL